MLPICPPPHTHTPIFDSLQPPWLLLGPMAYYHHSNIIFLWLVGRVGPSVLHYRVGLHSTTHLFLWLQFHPKLISILPLVSALGSSCRFLGGEKKSVFPSPLVIEKASFLSHHFILICFLFFSDGLCTLY